MPVEQHIRRIDGVIGRAGFGERHNVSRLIGAPPGCVGYEEAGQLTEAMRRKPYSVVLLDEIEKAHPEVFNVLLQVFDDGRLTDGRGRTVDFANTVLIMTSNIGSELMVSSTQWALGFAPASETDTERPVRERLMRRLRDEFRPEFLNRIDDIIVFRRLVHEQLRQITELLLEDTKAAGARPGRRPTPGTSPSSAPGRCAAPSSGRWATSCPGCCSTAASTPARRSASASLTAR